MRLGRRLRRIVARKPRAGSDSVAGSRTAPPIGIAVTPSQEPILKPRTAVSASFAPYIDPVKAMASS